MRWEGTLSMIHRLKPSYIILIALAASALLATSCPSSIEDVNVREAKASGLDYSFVVWRASLPAEMPAGELVGVPVEILNNGRNAWLDDGEPFFLSYHWKHPGGQFNSSMFWGERTPLPGPVGPGEIVSLEMKILAPAQAKYYDLTIDMVRGASRVRNEVFWFEEGGWQTFNRRIKVSGQ